MVNTLTHTPVTSHSRVLAMASSLCYVKIRLEYLLNIQRLVRRKSCRAVLGAIITLLITSVLNCHSK